MLVVSWLVRYYYNIEVNLEEYNYKEVECKSALHYIKSKMPYEWDLNIYRGCQHGCKYCFALYTHEYLNDSEYYQNIYIKTNIVEQLEKKLMSKSWKRDIINIGGITDSYQPLEAKYKIMPEILRLLIKYKTPAVISSKSDLILRDFDLVAELAEVAGINIAATIITTDEVLRKKLEPNGSPISNRFKMLEAFKKTRASTGVHIMPIIPYLTDNYANLNSIFYNATVIQADYILPGLLNLRGKSREVFLDFLKKDMPYKYTELHELYNSRHINPEYKLNLDKLLTDLFITHKLSNAYMEPLYKRLAMNQ